MNERNFPLLYLHLLSRVNRIACCLFSFFDNKIYHSCLIPLNFSAKYLSRRATLYTNRTSFLAHIVLVYCLRQSSDWVAIETVMQTNHRRYTCQFYFIVGFVFTCLLFLFVLHCICLFAALFVWFRLEIWVFVCVNKRGITISIGVTY